MQVHIQDVAADIWPTSEEVAYHYGSDTGQDMGEQGVSAGVRWGVSDMPWSAMAASGDREKHAKAAVKFKKVTQERGER